MHDTTATHANKLSEELLLAVKKEENTLDLEQQIADLKGLEELRTDDLKKAFWINIYNAYFLILRKQRKVEKSKIYTTSEIGIAGQLFSLDDVEHGILRKYRYKYSMGYFPNLFADSRIKRLAVDKIDYRIHFALNCGAASCPPIAFYTSDRIDSQLELATASFVESDTEIDEQNKTLYISKLFSWFKGDFGGNKGIRKILTEHLKIDINGYRLKYKEYDWSEHLDNYMDIDVEAG